LLRLLLLLSLLLQLLEPATVDDDVLSPLDGNDDFADSSTARSETVAWTVTL
jgi:hypothetical protein